MTLEKTYFQQIMRAATSAVALSALLLSGCGSGMVSSITGGSLITSTHTTDTQALITDAPADQVLCLSVTVDSIRMYNAAGNYAEVLTTPARIDASHLDAVQEPLREPLKIPQDTYTSASITVENPVVAYVDSTGKVIRTAATLTSGVDVVTFAAPITVTATSAPISFDLLVGQSVSISGTTVSVTPTFNVTTIPLASNPTHGGNGKVSDIQGAVVSTSSAGLVIQIASGAQIKLAIDAHTEFQGFASLSALTAGQLVEADVAVQPDGSLLALRIHLCPPNVGNLLTGPVTALSGSPLTGFTIVLRQPLGPGVGTSGLGTPYAITVNSSTTYAISARIGTLPTLPFPALFSAAKLSLGQNVQVGASAVNATAATATAATVTLEPQTVGGTVASISTASGLTTYTVTLPATSALGTLTGATSVVVYIAANSQMANSTPIAVGSTVRFNGLLFNDAGTLRLVTVECHDGPPSAPPQRH